MSAIFRTSLFVILFCQRILNIRLRHLHWKTSIFFSAHLLIFHVSQPYIKTGFTSVLYSLTLVRRPGGGGVLDISLGGEVRRGPSYPDPV